MEGDDNGDPARSLASPARPRHTVATVAFLSPRHRRFAFLLLLGALVSCKGMSCQSTPPEEFLRLMPVIGSAPGFTADALENVKTSRGDRLVTSSRWFFKKKPSRLRMETPSTEEAPFLRLAVFDGKTTWMNVGDHYFSSSDLLPPHLWMLDGWPQNSLRAFKRISFQGASRMDGTEVEAFEFTLADGAPPMPWQMKQILIAFGKKDGVPRKIVAKNERGEVETEVVFTNVHVDGDLSDELFTFTVPPGTAVEELR